jgi:hypothetical protein
VTTLTRWIGLSILIPLVILLWATVVGIIGVSVWLLLLSP